MKISIIVPRWVARANDYYAFPLGLAYISSVLKRDGHIVTVLNCNNYHEPVEKLICDFIDTNTPEIVCTGGLSVHFNILRDLLSSVKKVSGNITTVLGGGIISSDPELIYDTIKPDFGVIGEGEITISELVKAIEKKVPFNDIPGLIFRDKTGHVIITEERKPIIDLDSLPWPDYESFEIEKQLEAMLPTDEAYLHMHDKPRMLPMISSRSCPYNCSFCFHPTGNRYRERSLDAFFKELDYLVNHYRLNSVMILDELFAVKRDRLIEFCKRIRQYKITWIVQLRVDIVDEEMLLLMKESGCVFISYGIESMSDNILASMQKKITRKQIESALELTFKVGIGIQGNLLFGDKVENDNTIEESILWWSEHRKYQINITPICSYPGTKLYKDACEKGLVPDKVSFLEKCCPPINITSMPDYKFNDLMRMVDVLNVAVNTDALTGVKNVRLMPEKSPLRNDNMVEFETECPYCHSSLAYKNIPLSKNPMGRFTLRMACRYCNGRIDIAMSLRPEFQESQEIKNLMRLAEECMFKGAPKESLDFLLQIIKLSPFHCLAAFFLGKVMLRLGDIDNALNWLALSVKINPLIASTQASLASALAMNKKYFESMLYMKQVWKLYKIETDREQAHILQLFKVYVNEAEK
jgi:radical SAM superfamily enzyme YgiQ (UPF0313 family)